MIRICSSLSAAGYPVLLIGVKESNSLPLQQREYEQKRLACLFTNGLGFYAEYNTRLFFYLFFKKSGAICAIAQKFAINCVNIKPTRTSGLRSTRLHMKLASKRIARCSMAMSSKRTTESITCCDCENYRTRQVDSKRSFLLRFIRKTQSSHI